MNLPQIMIKDQTADKTKRIFLAFKYSPLISQQWITPITDKIQETALNSLKIPATIKKV